MKTLSDWVKRKTRMDYVLSTRDNITRKFQVKGEPRNSKYKKNGVLMLQQIKQTSKHEVLVERKNKT